MAKRREESPSGPEENLPLWQTLLNEHMRKLYAPGARPPLELRETARARARIQALLDLPADQRGDLVVHLFQEIVQPRYLFAGTAARIRPEWERLADELLAGFPIGEERLLALAEHAAGQKRFWDLPVPTLVAAFEDHVRANGLSEPVRDALEAIAETLESFEPDTENDALVHRVRRLLGQDLTDVPGLPLRRGDAWINALLDELRAMPPDLFAAWTGILHHCSRATHVRPSRRWRSWAKEYLDRLPPGEFVRVATLVLGRVGRPGSWRFPRRVGYRSWHYDRTLLDGSQVDLLRGLVWCAGLVDDPGLATALGDAAEACFEKVERHGPRDLRLGQACLDSLRRPGTPTAVDQLAALERRVRYASVRRLIQAELAAVDSGFRRSGVAVQSWSTM